MRKVAILSTDNLEDFFVYDRLLSAPLKELGWEAVEVSWHETQHNWDHYDVVVVRSTWDYQVHCQEFLSCLQTIHQSSAILCNSMSLIEWNISKKYLKELEEKGVPIIPTLWVDELQAADFEQAFSMFNSNEVVVKPYVSANADFTYRLTRETAKAKSSQIVEEYINRSAMIQPFLSSILEEGEYSLFYFDSQYSHAICKQPAKGDFRVQEEHGGQLSSIKPTEQMLALAEKTIAALPEDALYARIDIVSSNDKLMIIEVELIEPSLYFNMDDSSPTFFAQVFANKFAQ
ncbi:MAG: glutathione synthase/RimK-type ligase-like ATP-grasp enzyme [Glaciecola sp.]|jgi:glutathione synthase/RimK-type ligase-like ATP-grasp enzyme